MVGFEEEADDGEDHDGEDGHDDAVVAGYQNRAMGR